MKIGKTLYALVNNTEKYITWDFEDPFVSDTKKGLLERLASIKEYQDRDLLNDGEGRKIRKVRIELID